MHIHTPSKYGLAHPNMKRDVFGEICQALHKETLMLPLIFPRAIKKLKLKAVNYKTMQELPPRVNIIQV